MRATRVIGIVLAALVGATVAGILDSRSSSDRILGGYSSVKSEVDPPPIAKTEPPHEDLASAAVTPPSPPPMPKPVASPATNQPNPAISLVLPSTDKAPILDPAARSALSLVGSDPDAELYWLATINNPEIPAEERKDLIEDLNEDGLSNPKNPTPDDMALIWSRIELIEEIAPDAMDEVNAAAFAEVYKDLMNLAYGLPPD